MNCIHGLGNNVIDYVIYDIHAFNQVVNFYILNNHKHNFDHKHFTLTLNFERQVIPITKNYNNENHLIFDKSKIGILLIELNVMFVLKK